MSSKNFRLKINSDKETRLKRMEEIHVFMKAAWTWFNIDVRYYNDEILRIFTEMQKICNSGDAQCNERYDLLSTSPAMSIKNLNDDTNNVHTTRYALVEKLKDFENRLTKLKQSIQIEKAMFLKHVPPTDAEIIKNMTNQELKTTLEQFSARNEVIQNWKTSLQAFVDEGNNHLIPEIQEAYKGWISLMEDLCKKCSICK